MSSPSSDSDTAEDRSKKWLRSGGVGGRRVRSFRRSLDGCDTVGESLPPPRTAGHAKPAGRCVLCGQACSELTARYKQDGPSKNVTDLISTLKDSCRRCNVTTAGIIEIANSATPPEGRLWVHFKKDGGCMGWDQFRLKARDLQDCTCSKDGGGAKVIVQQPTRFVPRARSSAKHPECSICNVRKDNHKGYPLGHPSANQSHEHAETFLKATAAHMRDINSEYYEAANALSAVIGVGPDLLTLVGGNMSSLLDSFYGKNKEILWNPACRGKWNAILEQRAVTAPTPTSMPKAGWLQAVVDLAVSECGDRGIIPYSDLTDEVLRLKNKDSMQWVAGETQIEWRAAITTAVAPYGLLVEGSQAQHYYVLHKRTSADAVGLLYRSMRREEEGGDALHFATTSAAIVTTNTDSVVLNDAAMLLHKKLSNAKPVKKVAYFAPGITIGSVLEYVGGSCVPSFLASVLSGSPYDPTPIDQLDPRAMEDGVDVQPSKEHYQSLALASSCMMCYSGIPGPWQAGVSNEQRASNMPSKLQDSSAFAGHSGGSKYARKQENAYGGASDSSTVGMLIATASKYPDHAKVLAMSSDNCDWENGGSSDGNAGTHIINREIRCLIIDPHSGLCEAPDLVQSTQRTGPLIGSAPPISDETPEAAPIVRKSTPTLASKDDQAVVTAEVNRLAGTFMAQSRQEDLAWVFFGTSDGGKLKSGHVQWTEFNKHIRRDQSVPKLDRQLALAPIMLDPVSAEGIKAILDSCIELKDATGALVVFLDCDVGEWTKIVQQLFNSDYESSIIPTQGGFHTQCKMIASIDKVFRSAGLDQLLINARILAGDASASSALAGKHSNRGIRALKIVYEVIRCNQVCQYRADGGEGKWSEFQKVVPDIYKGGDESKRAVHGKAMSELANEFLQWQTAKASGCGRCTLVSTLMEMIETLLAFIRASRDVRSAKNANGEHVGFANYIKAIEAMQPWLAAADRLLYMRVLEAQVQIFKSIEARHGAEVMKAVYSGAVVGIQRTGDHFAAIWNDLHLEQVTNAESKRLVTATASRHPSVRSRIAAMPNTAATSNATANLVPPNLRSSRTPRKMKAKPLIPAAPKRMDLDRKNLSESIEALDLVCACVPSNAERKGDPTLMRHFTAGTTVTQDVVDDLSNVKSIGQRKVDLYSMRFPSGDESGKYMWDLVSKTNIKNFQWQEKQFKQKTPTVRTLGTCLFELTALNDQRGAGTAWGNKIPVWSANGDFLAKYEFGDFSRAFFHSDGKKRTGTKASLAPALAGNRPTLLKLNDATTASKQSTAVAVDFMAYVQMSTAKIVKDEHKYLEDLLLVSVKRALSDVISQHACTAYIVCDPYPEEGVTKDCESEARAATGVIAFDKIYGSTTQHPTLMLPPLMRRKFLRLAQNKRHLLALLESVLKRVLQTGKYADITTVFLTGAGRVMQAIRLDRILTTTAGSTPTVTIKTATAPWLESSCPEADQTLLVAARHWASEEGGGEMIIASWDTDVLVSLIALAPQLVGTRGTCKLACLRGVGARRERVDVWAARERLALLPAIGSKENANLILSAIIVMHTVTGCDGVPFIYLKGKKKCFAALCTMLNIKGGKGALKAMARTGIDETMSIATRQSYTTLYLLIYGMYGKAKDLDHARGLMWTALKCDQARFPPTEGSLDVQVKRTSTQVRITLMAVGDHTAPLPEPDGYVKVTGTDGRTKWQMQLRGEGQHYAPLQLLQMKPCNCHSAKQKTVNRHYCRTAQCTCFQRGIPCTERCACEKKSNVCHNRTGQDLSAMAETLANAAATALVAAADSAEGDASGGGAAGAAGAAESDVLDELSAHAASKDLTVEPEDADTEELFNVEKIHGRKFMAITCDSKECACWALQSVGGGKRRKRGGVGKAMHYRVEWEGCINEIDWSYEPVQHINQCSHWRTMLEAHIERAGTSQAIADVWFGEDSPSFGGGEEDGSDASDEQSESDFDEEEEAYVPQESSDED